MKAMNRPFTACMLTVVAACAGPAASQIVHDAEYYILEAQNGERWAAEDEALDVRLAALRKKHGRWFPPDPSPGNATTELSRSASGATAQPTQIREGGP